MQNPTQTSNPRSKIVFGLSDQTNQTDAANLIISSLNSLSVTQVHTQPAFPDHTITIQNPPTPKKDISSEEEQSNSEVPVRGSAPSFKIPQEPDNLNVLHPEPQLMQPETHVSPQILQENNDNRQANQQNEDYNRPTRQLQDEEASHTEEAIAQNLYLVLKKFAWFKFWRTLIIYTLTFIGSVILSSIKENKLTSYMGVYMLTYIFLIYLLAEYIIKISSHDILQWKRTENIYAAISVTILIIFLVFIQLRFNGINIETKWILILYAFCLLGYTFQVNAPEFQRQFQISKKALIGIQLFLIALKIDGNLDWDWMALLYLAILCLIFTVICFILLLALLIYILIAPLLNRIPFSNVAKPTVILGFLWSALFCALVIPMMIGIIALAIQKDYDIGIESSIIGICLTIVEYLSLALIFFTALAYKYILDYLVHFNLEKSFYEEQLTPPGVQRDRSKFIREKKTAYFIKLSSTYFSPLKINFARKSALRKKFKRVISQVRSRRFLRKLANPEDSVNLGLNLDESICVKELQNDKIKLDRIFKKEAIERNSGEQGQDLEKQNKIDLLQRVGERQFISEVDREKPILSESDLRKVCFSEDLEAHGFSEEGRGKNFENLCHICFEKLPDAIFGECGHGGLCTNCALEIVKVKGECTQCRRNVEKVIRIELDAQVKDIVRGYETLTIVSKK